MKPPDTERLTFRPVAMDDADVLDALNNAPGVMRFLDHQPPSREHLVGVTLSGLMNMAANHPGYGLWLAHTKDREDCIGWFELEPDQETVGDAEIGYRLFPRHWGNGFATEGAREVLRYAFEDLQVVRCRATTMAVNTPSRAVMERIGLRFVGTFHEEFDHPLPGTEEGEVEYALTRDEWLLRRA